MRCAAPRGNSVSESSVMTYFTFGRIAKLPDFTGKGSYFPRRNWFRSISFPRFRSHPIQPFSRGL